MTYNHVNRILEGDYRLITKYKHIYDSIIAMAQLSEIIRDKREGNGSIDFEKPESIIELNDQGKISDIKVRERKFAERMIEDFMITANECVAKHMKWLEYPCLYRVHEQPTLKKMREFARVAKIMGYNWNGSIQNVYPKQFQELLNESRDTLYRGAPWEAVWQIALQSFCRESVLFRDRRRSLSCTGWRFLHIFSENAWFYPSSTSEISMM